MVLWGIGGQRPPWFCVHDPLATLDSHLTHLLCVVSHLAVRLTSDSGELTHHSHLTHIYLLTTDSLRTHLAKTPRLFYRFKIEISAIVSPKSSKFQEVTCIAELLVDFVCLASGFVVFRLSGIGVGIIHCSRVLPPFAFKTPIFKVKSGSTPEQSIIP